MEASWAATRKPARAMSRSALPQSKSENSLNRSIPPGPGCAKMTRRGRQSVSRTTSALSYLYLSPRALFNVVKKTAERASYKTRSNVFFTTPKKPCANPMT